LYKLLFSPMCIICPTYLILSDMIIIITRSSSLRNYFQPPGTSLLLDRNILLGTLLRSTILLYSSLNVTPSFAPIQNYRQTYISILNIKAEGKLVPVFN
jgi:hypothetical protein